MSPNPFVDWGQRLPNYSPAASQDHSRLRERNSFAWAMLSDGGLVITDADWEVHKGLSSSTAIEAMDIPALLERVFHLKPRDCFPAAPSFLRGVGGVPSGSAFPPLWSLRFFASRIYGRGGPDGSHPASASEKRRFGMMVRAELVVCVTLGVAAERDVNQRTQVLPVELINLLLGYNRGDEILTHRGTISVRATGERLMRARSVDQERHETERPLHVSGLLYYVPETVLDAAVPAPAAASPARSAPIRVASHSQIPARLSAPRELIVGIVSLPFLAVLLLLFPYDQSPFLEVPPIPFLSLLFYLLLPSVFCHQLGFLHLPRLLESRRDLGRRFGRRLRFLTWSPPL